MTTHPVIVHESGDLDELDTHRVPEADVARAPGRWATNLLTLGAGYLTLPAQGWPERPGLSQIKIWNRGAPAAGTPGNLLVCESYDDATQAHGWPIAAAASDLLETESSGWLVMDPATAGTSALVTVRYTWFVPTEHRPIEHRSRDELFHLFHGFAS